MRNISINRFEWLKAVMQAEGLTPTAKNVASAIAVQFANDETGQINPSQGTLADYLKVHKDTVKRVLRELRNAGWLLAMGDGGRGKSPLLRLLTPGKIVPFRARKGGAIHPAQEEKRGGNLQQKGGQIIPRHYKDKQSLEQKGQAISDRRPVALDQFMGQRFAGNATDGPQVIPSSNHGALNQWAEWLQSHDLPKLHQLPIQQKTEKGNATYFWLPNKNPPTATASEAEAISFFQSLIDWEAASHAAQ